MRINSQGGIEMLDTSSREIKGEAVTIELPSLEEWPISHLRKACKKNKVKGYSKMSKDELVEAIKQLLRGLDNKKEELK